MTDSLERIGAGSVQKRGGDGQVNRERFANGNAMPADRCNRQAQDLLAQVGVESMPRLALVRAGQPAPFCQAGTSWSLEPDEVNRFSGLLVKGDMGAAASFIDGKRALGAPLDTLYLDLLAPAARRLGDLWDEDLCDFADVTVGLCRLQQLLRGLSASFVHETDQEAPSRRALLVTVPGEQHSFGLFMVAEFFRKAGWDVTTATPVSRDELASLVRHDWFDVVGLSSSCEDKIEAMASAIRTIRRASRNRNASVMVGGPMFVAHPDYADLIGADATATDGRQAPVQAQKLLASNAKRC